MAEHRRTSGESAPARRLDFGEFRFDCGARQLWRGSEEIKLPPRASALLAALAERSTEIVTKEELIDRVWDGKAVGDDALTSCVQELRRALGDDPRNPKLVETRHRRGYRLRVPATPASETSAASRPGLPPPAQDKASVAVLPFQNMSGDVEQDYFADGIAEDILTALSKFPSLLVIARTSSFTYKGKSVTVEQVGRELGVRYVLEGSVRKSSGRVRISAQLIQTAGGAHIWADRYDGDLGDMFALQDRITEAVVSAIAPSIQKVETELAQRKPPDSLDAYDRYLRASALYCAMTKEASDEARALLEQAIALDPGFVAPVTLLTLVLDGRIAQGWSTPAEIAAETKKYVQLARSIDRHNPDVLAIEARAIAYLDGRHDEAIALIWRALSLNPNSVVSWVLAGWVYVYAGQPDSALAHLQRALRLNPRDPADFQTLTALAHAFLQLGRDEEALAAARRVTHQTPNFVAGWRVLAAVLALLGRVEEARKAMATVLRLTPAASLTGMRSMPTWSAAARSRYFEGLGLAGMPP